MRHYVSPLIIADEAYLLLMKLISLSYLLLMRSLPYLLLMKPYISPLFIAGKVLSLSL